MQEKKNLRIVIVIIGISIVSFFYFRGKINRIKFYESKINSLIIKRDNWQLRTTVFYLKNELRIDSSTIETIDLKIYDSIVKEANSWEYKVYRKSDETKYDYINTYIMDN